jgi:hypothetical protein
MANLKKLEPVAFVLLFTALYYALVVLAPHSALYDFPTAETLAGLAALVVAGALVVLRCLPRRRWHVERLIYAGFLAAMPFIYLAAALRRGSSFDIVIELVGVPVFVGLAVFGYYKSFLTPWDWSRRSWPWLGPLASWFHFLHCQLVPFRVFGGRSRLELPGGYPSQCASDAHQGASADGYAPLS